MTAERWPRTLSDEQVGELFPGLTKKHEMVSLAPRHEHELEATYAKTYEGWILLDPVKHGHDGVER